MVHRSNNPFAPPSNIPPVPSLSNPSSPSQNSLPSFNLPGTYANSDTNSITNTTSSFSPIPSSTSSPASGSQRLPTKADQTHSQLASLFANRDDGQDTFGNIGLLRCVNFHVVIVLCFYLLPPNVISLSCLPDMDRPMLVAWLLNNRATIRSHSSSSSSSNNNNRVTTTSLSSKSK